MPRSGGARREAAGGAVRVLDGHRLAPVDGMTGVPVAKRTQQSESDGAVTTCQRRRAHRKRPLGGCRRD